MAVHDHLEDLRVGCERARDDNPQERVQLLQDVLQPLVHLGLFLVAVVIVEPIVVIRERPQLDRVVRAVLARACGGHDLRCAKRERRLSRAMSWPFDDPRQRPKQTQ